MGKLEAIWLKRMKAGPMDSVKEATLKAHEGLAGNANQGGKRQVTLIEQEVWQNIMEELGASLDPSARRANLMVSGIRLPHTRQQVLQIGNCRIQIYGETKPCELMTETLPGLKEALAINWNGGVFGEILDDGKIEVGDSVRWIV